jgi:Aminopeptidase N
MLRHQLGDTLFWKAMNHYTTAHAYGNVISDDLRVAFEQTTGRDYKPFFQQWVYGAGFPVFRISSSYDPASGRLVIKAREVQPRDSLTGFFDVDADVEVRTDSAVALIVVPVRNGVGEGAINLKSPPRSLRWDKGNWILDLADFPRSTSMMQYQLTHDDDVLGRIEAVDVLRQRPRDQTALTALISAGSADRFWAVRQRAVDALAAWQADSSRGASQVARSVEQALLDATGDRDARVRSRAASALGQVPGGGALASEVIGRLRAIATSDASFFVRGDALASYVRLEKNSALPLVREMLVPDLWRDAIRRPVLEALKTVDTPEARELVQRYTVQPPQ